MPPTRPRLRPGDLTAADGSVTLTALDELVMPHLDVEAAGHHLAAGAVLRVGVTAEHVDTPDLALLRSATALTRRTLTGDVDRLPPALRDELGPWSGWQLDAPGDGAVTTTRRVTEDVTEDDTDDDTDDGTPHDDSSADSPATTADGSATAPTEVTRWLLATVRGKDLVTALRTRAEVSVHLLVDSDSDTAAQHPADAGSDEPTTEDAPTAPAVVEVVERLITSTLPGRDVATTSRELRVAPTAGATPLRRRDVAALVNAVVVALVDAGATPLAAADVAARGSRATAVLRRALDAADPGSAPTQPTPAKPPTMASPAPDVVRAALTTGLTTLVAADRTWRGTTTHQQAERAPRQDTAALTALEGAARRAHAALTLDAALRPGAGSATTADELTWLTGLLDAAARVRAAERLIVDLLRASPVNTVRGRARENLLAALTQRVDAASTHARDALTSQRYLDLLDALENAATPTHEDPPSTTAPARGQGGRTTLLRLAAAADRRLVDDAEQVDVALDQDSHDALLDRVRHAALSAAALAALLADVAGADSQAYADDVSTAAHHLARHADTVGARELLEAEALAADASGLSSFTHGRLHGQVTATGEAEDAAYEQAWASASRPRRRRWMA